MRILFHHLHCITSNYLNLRNICKGVFIQILGRSNTTHILLMESTNAFLPNDFVNISNGRLTSATDSVQSIPIVCIHILDPIVCFFGIISQKIMAKRRICYELRIRKTKTFNTSVMRNTKDLQILIVVKCCPISVQLEGINTLKKSHL